ncbi:MAG: hypothetical protein ACO2O0_04145 [Desulfurococcales archaeon]|jgi:hypothetical protein
MASIDLGGGFGCIAIHDTEEKITPSKPLSVVFEVEESVGIISKAVLLISTRSMRSIYNSRLRISVNGFNISRVAKPFSELLYKGEYHSIFTYDLMPIRERISGRAEIEIDSKDHEIYVDGISLTTIHILERGNEYSSNSIHVGPYVLGNGERAYIRVRSFKGGDMVIRGIAMPRGRSQADIDLSLGSNNIAKKISVHSNTELYIKIPNIVVDGDEKIELRIMCSSAECYTKIPWIFIMSSRIKSPEYMIKDLFLSDSDKTIILEFENLGDIDANELRAIAIWRGNIVGRSVIKPSKSGRIALPITIKGAYSGNSDLKEYPLIVRIIWKWLGRVEERERILTRSGPA